MSQPEPSSHVMSSKDWADILQLDEIPELGPLSQSDFEGIIEPQNSSGSSLTASQDNQIDLWQQFFEMHCPPGTTLCGTEFDDINIWDYDADVAGQSKNETSKTEESSSEFGDKLSKFIEAGFNTVGNYKDQFVFSY